MTHEQLIFVVILAIVLLLILPMYKSRTGKDFSEVIFGRKKQQPGTVSRDNTGNSKKEPHLNNGTAGDLRYFLSSLVKIAARKKMQVVAPGTLTSGGKTAPVTAWLVHKSGVTGVICLGFNGTIVPSDKGMWLQHMNGQDILFDDPVRAQKEYYDVACKALRDAGITVPLDFATVFTTHTVKLDGSISEYPGIYHRNRFLDHVRKSPELNQGDLDVRDTALRIAKLAGIDRLKAQEKAGSSGKR